MIDAKLAKNMTFLIHVLKIKNYSPYVLAIINTEMFFRSSKDRTVEYFAWIFLWLIQSKRVSTLSIGVAQIQMRHWKTLGFISSYKPTLSNVLTILNYQINYRACEKYMEKFDINKLSTEEIAKIYNGNMRKYYCSILNKSFILSETLGSANKPEKGVG